MYVQSILAPGNPSKMDMDEIPKHANLLLLTPCDLK